MDQHTRRLLYKERPVLTVWRVLLALIVLFAIFWFNSPSTFSITNLWSRPSTASASSSLCDNPDICTDLKLVSQNCYVESDFWFFEGQVQNTTLARLKDITAVVTFTSKGEFVKTATALVDYTPLEPFQTTTFKVMASGPPDIDGCSVEFHILYGRKLSYKLAS